jgi:hypothetical protein
MSSRENNIVFLDAREPKSISKSHSRCNFVGFNYFNSKKVEAER